METGYDRRQSVTQIVEGAECLPQWRGFLDGPSHKELIMATRVGATLGGAYWEQSRLRSVAGKSLS